MQNPLSLQERINNLFLLVLFTFLAGWQLGPAPVGMYDAATFDAFGIARGFIEAGWSGVGELGAGQSLLWMGALGGLGEVFTRAIPVWMALLIISALPMLFFAWFCAPLVFVQILVATYFAGFGMEGVLASILFIALAWALQQRLRLLVVLVAALLVLCRVDFLICLAVLLIWALVRERSLMAALLVGSVLGVLLTVAGGWVIAGEIALPSVQQLLDPGRIALSVADFQANVTAPENLVRAGIWLGAVSILILARGNLGADRYRLLFSPVFHVALVLPVLTLSGFMPLHGSLFAVPLLVAIYAAGRAASGISWRVAPALLLTIAVPVVFGAIQYSRT
ncbi:hypothetical protein KHP62_04435 [Rhodobacteraceae bacterium NNCM2]|nr:hypothetical protein [Coraliihabitans acroporae]